MHIRAANFLAATSQEKWEMSKEDRPELFQIILDSNLPPEEKTVARIGSEGFAIMGAGGDTVARVIASTTFHVLSNPHVLTHLREELKEAIPNKSEIPSYKTLKELVWLFSFPLSNFISVILMNIQTSIIKEGLRIASPISSRLPMVPPTPLQYKEWTIPAKVSFPISSPIDLHSFRSQMKQN